MHYNLFKVEPKEALELMCHTSTRQNGGTVYTISDQRYPEYNGRQIFVFLHYGKNKIEWLAGHNETMHFS